MYHYIKELTFIEAIPQIGILHFVWWEVSVLISVVWKTVFYAQITTIWPMTSGARHCQDTRLLITKRKRKSWAMLYFSSPRYILIKSITSFGELDARHYHVLQISNLRHILWSSTYISLGAVSIRKTVLPGMAIPMLKIRRPNDRLIFNMEIAIRR